MLCLRASAMWAFLMVATCTAADPATPQPRALCERVVAARKALGTGTVTFRASDMWKGKRREVLLYRGVFDPRTSLPRIRGEMGLLYPLMDEVPVTVLSLEEGTVNSLERTIVNADTVMNYRPRRGVAPAGGVRMDSLKEMGRGPPILVIDPLILGMEADTINGIFLGRCKLGDILDYAQDETGRIERAELDSGRDVWKVTFPRNAALTTTFWIDEERGPSIVRAETRREYEAGDYLGHMDVELKEWGKGNWFPSTIKFQSHRGDKTGWDELVVIEEAKFGIPVTDSDFDVGGLKPHAGTDVADSTGKYRPGSKWDGTKVVEPPNN